MTATDKLRRVPLREALARLGIKRTSFNKYWRDVFTEYRNGRNRQVMSDELDLAVKHPDYHQAAGLVKVLRMRLKRM